MFRPVAVVLAVALLAGANSTRAEDAIAWLVDAGKAIKQAQAEHKPVFVDVWAVWCVPCAQLEKTTYKVPAVIEASRRFVSLKIDNDVQTLFVEAHRITAWPTLLFLDARGHELGRIEGYVDASTLEPIMRRVADGYGDYEAGIGPDASLEQLTGASEYLASCGNPDEGAALLQKALKAAKERELHDSIDLQLGRYHASHGNKKTAAKILQRLASEGSAEVKELARSCLESLPR